MARNIHLLVMIHGMWGTPDDLSEAKRIIGEKVGMADNGDQSKLEILVTQTNKRGATYDGVDLGGHRLAREVYEKITELEDGNSKVTAFSVFGYSLGGLLGRYLIGILHSEKFFDHVRPVNFTTFATPHIGVPRYPSAISTIAAFLGPKFLSRSGEQLFVIDKRPKTGKPLLEVLADKRFIFWRALSLFEHVHVYANAVSDISVPFATAAIELEDPFFAVHVGEMTVTPDPTYNALVHSYDYVDPPKFSFRSLFRSRPLLPIYLKHGFLFETTVIVLSPVILPTVLPVLALRLASYYRGSRARIRSIEADENNLAKLVAIESATENLGDANIGDDNLTTAHAAGFDTFQCPLNASRRDLPMGEHRRLHPILNDSQKYMASCLNDITQLKKHYVFLHPVQNTHGLIICRDAKFARYTGGEWHAWNKAAESVLRHWADNFVLT